MKKAIVFILAAMLLVIFASCGSSEKSGAAEGESTEISTETLAETEAEETAEESLGETSAEDVVTTLAEKITSALSTTAAKVISTTTKPAATSTTTTKPATTTTTAPATETTTETTTRGKPARSGVPFEFTTTDVNGNSVSLADYSYAKVIMINMWETWCGPCVNEMPDLQRLYAKYKDKGFLILGATNSEASDIRLVQLRTGVKYPIIMRNSQFDRFETGYVPTTVFIDSDGYVLSPEPFVGGKSYEEWEQILLGYLNE